VRKKFWALINLIRAAIGAARNKVWLKLPLERRLLASSNAIHKVL
jgi:hypothetical protein